MTNSDKPTQAPEDLTPAAALNEMLGFQLFRLSATLGALGERASQEVSGLTLPEYRCLAVLTTQGPLGVVALCQIMSIDRAWVSRTLTRLAEKELVVMRGDPNDGRKVFAEPTAQGRRIAKKLIARSAERQGKLFQGLSRSDELALRAMLEKIQVNADKLLE